MNNIKLTLTNWGDLDVGGVGAIPLNFNLNDIRDISSRGGVYSKTIKLFGTAYNNAILGPLFDVNTQFLSVNLQRIEPCVLVADGQVVLDGTFQIRRIYKSYSNENEIIMYDVYLKSNNSDFYTIIDGKFLTDLNLNQYNHVHDRATIMDSIRNGTELYGYQYYNAYVPVIEYPVGSANLLHLYEPEDFKPAIYVKSIMDRIFIEAGFTYTFEELYDLNIDKLIMTTNREKIVPGLFGSLFRAGILQEREYRYSFHDYANVLINASAENSEDPDYWQPIIPIETPRAVIFDENNNPEFNLIDPTNSYSTVYGEYTLDPDEQTMYFESTFVINTWIRHRSFVNTQNAYSVIDTEVPLTGLYSGNCRLDTQEYVTFPDGFDWNDPGGTQWINNTTDTIIRERVKVFLIAYDINDQPIFPPIAIQEIGINEYSINFNQKWRYVNYKNFTNEYTVNISGEFLRIQNPTAHKVKVIVSADFLLSSDQFWGYRWDGKGETLTGIPIDEGGSQYCTTEYGFDTRVLNPIGYFKNDASFDLYEGAYTNMSNVISTDIKQSDFLVSLINMYNLYIVDDKTNINNLIIKTRDKFYLDGEDYSWNDKIDITTIEVDVLSNSQTKIKNFLYTDDTSDLILKEYKNSAILEYGALRYTFYNQFIKSSSNIKPLFSPAALEWVFKKNIPLIPSRAKTNSKILSVGQVYANDIYFTYRIVNPNYGTVLSTEDQFVYRHVGHFYPNSFEPLEDINFGVCEYYAHNYSTITNNNLFNRFYRTQYDIFEKGYMMTAKFKLNYLDISELNMNERIFINNHWWNINRIIDFDLNSNSLTEVELISAEATNGEFIANNNLFIAKRLMSDTVNSWSNLTDKSNKMANTSRTEVYGRSNKIDDSTNSIVIGDFNYVRNKNGLVIGQSNIVNGSGIIALGSFNKTLTGNNKVYVNGLVEMVDLIDAGRNRVSSPFGQTTINLIDGGTDTILDYGSHSNIHLFDAN
jgi:hypothetical protein